MSSDLKISNHRQFRRVLLDSSLHSYPYITLTKYINPVFYPHIRWCFQQTGRICLGHCHWSDPSLSSLGHLPKYYRKTPRRAFKILRITYYHNEPMKRVETKLPTYNSCCLRVENQPLCFRVKCKITIVCRFRMKRPIRPHALDLSLTGNLQIKSDLIYIENPVGSEDFRLIYRNLCLALLYISLEKLCKLRV